MIIILKKLYFNYDKLEYKELTYFSSIKVIEAENIKIDINNHEKAPKLVKNIKIRRSSRFRL